MIVVFSVPGRYIETPGTPHIRMITEVDKTEVQWNVGLKLEALSERLWYSLCWVGMAGDRAD